MNSAQIDNTDYYRLPCGRYLEDFIAWKRLDFAEGSALKYRWRVPKPGALSWRLWRLQNQTKEKTGYA